MRIHELLEACVEYVAIDGVLGELQSEPALITRSNPSVARHYCETIVWFLRNSD